MKANALQLLESGYLDRTGEEAKDLIVVKTLNGSILHFKVDLETESVYDLKLKLYQKQGILVDSQKIIVQG